MLSGFGYTCSLFVLTLLFALPLGLLISFCAMSKWKPLKVVTRVVIWIVRGIPLMLQVCIIYYVPGFINPAWNFASNMNKWFNANWGEGWGYLGSVFAVSIAFIINYACYFAEIYRGGIEGISIGQHEAGQVLGLTKFQIFRYIVLKQVFKRILPPMSNEIITLVKDTALANVVGLPEIMFRANQHMGYIWPMFYAGVFYLIFVGGLTLLLGYIEKKQNYYKT